MSELKDFLNDFPRTRRERYFDYAIGAVFMAIMVTIAIIVIPFFPVALSEPPVEVNGVKVITTMPVCPGDLVNFESDITVTEPGIIGIWSGILDIDTNNIVPNTRQESVPVVRSTSGRITERISFVVPDIGPGNYIRVAGMVAINADTFPAFVNVPFVVAENCDRGD